MPYQFYEEARYNAAMDKAYKDKEYMDNEYPKKEKTDDVQEGVRAVPEVRGV